MPAKEAEYRCPTNHPRTERQRTAQNCENHTVSRDRRFRKSGRGDQKHDVGRQRGGKSDWINLEKREAVKSENSHQNE